MIKQRDIATVALVLLLAAVLGIPELTNSLVQPAEHSIGMWLFLRFIGVVYLVAFGSLALQVRGLIGRNGIMPVQATMSAIKQQDEKVPFLTFPTLFWWDLSDRTLFSAAVVGMLLSVLVIMDISTVLCLIILWCLYLSFVTVSERFLSYQWDALLLESGVLAIFLPMPGALFLLKVLLFKLMFMSGAVKLLSKDETWASHTAMAYHYETQPLPTPLAYYAHRLPPHFQRMSVQVVLSIELLLPFCIFGPSPFPQAAAIAFIALQGLIMITGNYAFFNLLSVALCVLLMPNNTLLMGSPVGVSFPALSAVPLWMELSCLPVFLALGALNLVPLLQMTGTALRLPPWLIRYYMMCAPLFLVSSYGLFAVMTTRRPEIVIEGTNDLQSWKEYELKYKPGDPARPPQWIAPYQPRLDWQLWFAALSDYYENEWLSSLALRLLQGQKNVLAFFKTNPFPDAPPKYIRARLFEYTFTKPNERKSKGYWNRKLLGTYLPTMTLGEN